MRLLEFHNYLIYNQNREETKYDASQGFSKSGICRKAAAERRHILPTAARFLQAWLHNSHPWP